MKFVIAALIGLAASVKVDKDYFTVFDHESTYYERVTTPRFSADTDDIFMRSMIENYAVEEGDCDEDEDGNEINCKPSGHFWMDKAGAYAAAQEILNTHKGLSGP